MRKALFILMLAVAGVFVGVLMSPARKPVWQPKTQIVFLGFTNTVSGAPAANMWFGVKDHPTGQVGWAVAEISHQENGKWKQGKPLPFEWPNFSSLPADGFALRGLIPMPTTNAPLRVVFELEQVPVGARIAPTGTVSHLSWNLRKRWRRLLHPENPREWYPRGPRFYITNEFNFASGTNAATAH